MEFRRAAVLRDGMWHVVPFETIRHGDLFRLWEKRTPLKVGDCSTFRAETDPVPCNPPGNFGLKATPIDSSVINLLLAGDRS